MLARILTIAILGAVAGCAAKPLETVRSGNPDVTAGLIAQIEGCNVYRILDGGHYVYLTVCPGASSRTTWQENCGKGCTREVQSLTARREGGI